MRVLCVGENVFLAIIKLTPNGEDNGEESRLLTAQQTKKRGI